jgi:SET domain-containing protein
MDLTTDDAEAVYVDAVASTHWTRFLNHAEDANVAYDVQPRIQEGATTVRHASLAPRAAAANGESDAGAGSTALGTTEAAAAAAAAGSLPECVALEAVFRTVRAVAAGEELAFDYGVEFWDGRSGGKHAEAKPEPLLRALA